jgi:outer membrane receptor protein involved in Fe transport
MVNVDVGAMGFNVNARYLSGGKFNTTYLPGDIDPQFADVGSVVTFDVGARYRFAEKAGAPELYLNIANVFDRDPPLLPSSALVGAQTNVGVYDTLGRYFTAGFRMRL